MLQKFPAVFDVTTLNGANGFKISGLAANSRLGVSVNTAGDINSDGITDLVIGAYGVNTYVGAAYVIFGQGSGFPSVFDVTTLNGANGFQISGLAGSNCHFNSNSSCYLGWSVSTAGDINGDSKTDLIIGADGVNNRAGAAYVIFGRGSGFPSVFDVTTLNGTNGFQIGGVPADSRLGISVSTAGDLNGDGKTDLVIGAADGDIDKDISGPGAAYVIFGQGSGFPANFNVTTLNGTNGFQISELASKSSLGFSVSTAGDLNDDNKTDLVIGAWGVNSGAGAAYVIFGQGSGFPANFNVTILNGTNGFQIGGLPAASHLGNFVSTAGDINSDGITDLVIGAHYFNNGAGAAYVIFGRGSGFPSVFDVTTLNGTNGFQIGGVPADSRLGISVSAAGDLNGDGKTDLVFGASNLNSGAGAAYVIFGQDSAFPANFNVITLNGANGFQISGLTTLSFLGHSVSTAGDINDDGKTDLVIGANFVNTLAGAGYVIFGSNTSITKNQAPRVTNPVFDQTAQLNQPFSFQIASNTFNDTEGDSLTYTAAQSGSSVLPNWLQFNNVTRFFSGIPHQIGILPVDVTASDPYGLTASTTFNINVQDSLNGGLIGGIIGGLAAAGGLVGAAYFARGFFASSRRNKNTDNNSANASADTEIELTKKTTISLAG